MELKLDIDDLEKDLKTFKRSALPFATRETLNQTAYHGRLIGRRVVQEKFTERNKWTRNSIRFKKTTGTLDIDQQESEVGSTEAYMRTQEEGGAERKKHKHGVAIPTSYAAGQGRSKGRTRLPRGKHKLKNIKFQRRQFTTGGPPSKN